MFVDGLFNSQNKGIHFYENIGNKNEPAWEFVSEKYQNIETYDGGRSSSKPTFADLDNDNHLDLIVGKNRQDDLYENEGNTTSSVFVLKGTDIFKPASEIWNFHIPLLTDINNNNIHDCFVGSSSGTEPYSSIFFYENFGITSKPDWCLDTTAYFDIHYPQLALVDIDNDLDLDMYIGSNDALFGAPPDLVYFRNHGTAEIKIIKRAVFPPFFISQYIRFKTCLLKYLQKFKKFLAFVRKIIIFSNTYPIWK